MKITTAICNSQLEALIANANSGYLKIYDAGDVMLCKIALGAKAFTTVAALTSNVKLGAGLSGLPSTAGAASYFKTTTGPGVGLWSDLCGTTTPARAMHLGSLTITKGVAVQITSWAVTHPQGSRA